MEKFEFEFEDLSAKNEIQFDYDEETDEGLSVVVEGNISVLYANKQAYMTLAKIFLKLALGEYSNGFSYDKSMHLV